MEHILYIIIHTYVFFLEKFFSSSSTKRSTINKKIYTRNSFPILSSYYFTYEYRLKTFTKCELRIDTDLSIELVVHQLSKKHVCNRLLTIICAIRATYNISIVLCEDYPSRKK